MKSNQFEKKLRILIVFLMCFFSTITVLLFGLYFYFSKDLPNIITLKNYKPNTITKIYSEDGEIIAEFFIEKREVTPLNKIPKHLIYAFVASEDARFFEHQGLDYLAILRAFLKNIFSGEIVQGGSTITQQVVKSILLSSERSFERKIKEAILSYRIERYLSKDEILFLYLNQIYLGHGVYGVATASKEYFGKEIEKLNLAESALLAGLPQAPTKYSPYTHPELARKRQIYVLSRMFEEGFISYDDLIRAFQTPLNFKNKTHQFLGKAPHFSEYIRRYIEEKYGKDTLYKKGLQVYTTIDMRYQKFAEEALELGLKEIEERQGYKNLESKSLEGALICFEIDTGYIKAMVGGRDFKRSQFNRVIQARRKTGSAFKPIIYASAIDKGYKPSSIIVDSPIVFEWGGKKWKPKNFEDKYFGPTTLRNAITHSLNTVTVKIAKDIGIEYIKEYAKKLGITSHLNDDLSMALGSSSLSLYELTKAYAVFANNGKIFKPIFIKKIIDRDGKVIEENQPNNQNQFKEEQQAISPQTAYIMTYLLEGVIQNGTGRRAKALGRPVAGKTGTTDNFLDAWFIGYTPEIIAGVWVGFDEEKSLGEGETGARAALPIWINFMSMILKDKPIRDFTIPDGVIFVKIDPKTGKISSSNGAILECFKEEKSSYLVPKRGLEPLREQFPTRP